MSDEADRGVRTARQPSHHEVAAAVRATYAAFIGAGFVVASFASRIPQVRDRLHLSPSELGLVLLATAVGSLTALPLGGTIIARLGTRRTVATMVVVATVGVATIAVGYLVGVVPVLAGLFLLGFGNGAWDVAMNVHGADVERHLTRAIMPKFHAGFSVGTVAGALVGAAMVALGVSVTVHLLLAAALVAAVLPVWVQRFLPDRTPAAGHDGSGAPARSALARWREPRTLLVGLVVLAFAFAEGAGADWINVSLIDGYGAAAAVGGLGFATFLAAMTAARWFGSPLLDRFGRVVVVRALAAVAILGVLVFVFSPSLPVAFLGAALWGVGASLGFPVGMSAASDDPDAAAGRVSVVASIGYVAFLGGPPLVGFLGDHVTVLRALLAVAVLLGVAITITPAMRPLRQDDENDVAQ
jgi:fucose permease